MIVTKIKKDMKKTENSKNCLWCRELDPLLTIGSNLNGSAIMENIVLSQILNRITIWSSNFTFEHIPKKVRTQRDICLPLDRNKIIHNSQNAEAKPSADEKQNHQHVNKDNM